MALLWVGWSVKHKELSSPHSCMNVKINFPFKSGRAWPAPSLHSSGNRLLWKVYGGSHSFPITSLGKCRPLNAFIQNTCLGGEHVTQLIYNTYLYQYMRGEIFWLRKMFSCDIFLGISLKDRCRTFLWVLSSHSSQVDLCLHLKWMIMRKFLMNFKESLTALFFIIALALFPIFCCLPYCQSFCSFCPICRYRGALAFLSWD